MLKTLLECVLVIGFAHPLVLTCSWVVFQFFVWFWVVAHVRLVETVGLFIRRTEMMELCDTDKHAKVFHMSSTTTENSVAIQIRPSL